MGKRSCSTTTPDLKSEDQMDRGAAEDWEGKDWTALAREGAEA